MSDVLLGKVIGMISDENVVLHQHINHFLKHGNNSNILDYTEQIKVCGVRLDFFNEIVLTCFSDYELKEKLEEKKKNILLEHSKYFLKQEYAFDESKKVYNWCLQLELIDKIQKLFNKENKDEV